MNEVKFLARYFVAMGMRLIRCKAQTRRLRANKTIQINWTGSYSELMSPFGHSSTKRQEKKRIQYCEKDHNSGKIGTHPDLR